MNKPEIIISNVDLDAIEKGLSSVELTPDFVVDLESELGRAKVVKTGDLPNDVVCLNRQVTFRVRDTNKVYTRTLTVPEHSNTYVDSLSVFAPLGAALIGLKVGKIIDWQTSRGVQTVEVLAVEL